MIPACDINQRKKKIQDRISQKENQQHGNGTEYYVLGKKYIYILPNYAFLFYFSLALQTLSQHNDLLFAPLLFC